MTKEEIEGLLVNFVNASMHLTLHKKAKEIKAKLLAHIEELEKRQKCPHYNEYTWVEPPLEPDENGTPYTEYECKLANFHFFAGCEGDKNNCYLITKLYEFLKEYRETKQQLKARISRLEKVGNNVIRCFGWVEKGDLLLNQNPDSEIVAALKELQQALAESGKEIT